MTARSYCFTLNNPTDGHLCTLRKAIEHPLCRYICWQREQAATGTPHLQGYVELHSPARVARTKVMLGAPSIHLESRKGTRDQARDYCRKPGTSLQGTWETFGEWIAGPGARTDLAAVGSAIQAGSTDRQIALDFPGMYIRYHRGISAYRQAIEDSLPRGAPRVEVFWGPTGVGKSRRASELAPTAYWWARPQNSACYAYGYAGQTTVIFDDFYGWLPFDFLLRLIDRNPLRVNTQGQNVSMKANHFIFTSNKDPASWYTNFDPAPLMRRLTEFGVITHVPFSLYPPAPNA